MNERLSFKEYTQEGYRRTQEKLLIIRSDDVTELQRMVRLGRNVLESREQKGLTRTQLAERTGVNEDLLTFLEHGLVIEMIELENGPLERLISVLGKEINNN